jgi:hypothetical protein
MEFGVVRYFTLDRQVLDTSTLDSREYSLSLFQMMSQRIKVGCVGLVDVEHIREIQTPRYDASMTYV